MTAQPKTEPALTGQEETPNGSKKGARGRGRGRPRMNEEEERAQMSQISAEQKAISQKIREVNTGIDSLVAEKQELIKKREAVGRNIKDLNSKKKSEPSSR